MTTSGLVYIENKPQDQQQLPGGKMFWSNKKLQFGLILCFGMVYILENIYSINALFMFWLCYHLLRNCCEVFLTSVYHK